VKTARKDRSAVEIIRIGEWNSYWKELLTEGRISYSGNETMTREITTEGNLITVTTGELGRAVRILKTGKAAGPGNIPAHLLKNVKECLSEDL
jgi:ribosomal 50S subunit-recycling heat shock protein